jgi:hypothetical protein
MEASARITNESFCRSAAVYGLIVPGEFVSTLERSFVLASLNSASIDMFIPE